MTLLKPQDLTIRHNCKICLPPPQKRISTGRMNFRCADSFLCCSIEICVFLCYYVRKKQGSDSNGLDYLPGL